MTQLPTSPFHTPSLTTLLLWLSAFAGTFNWKLCTQNSCLQLHKQWPLYRCAMASMQSIWHIITLDQASETLWCATHTPTLTHTYTLLPDCSAIIAFCQCNGQASNRVQYLQVCQSYLNAKLKGRSVRKPKEYKSTSTRINQSIAEK